MQLEYSFTVPVTVEVAWQALLDPQRVAPCFPGATVTGVEGTEFSGNVKVRMGPVSLLYKGTGRFVSVDEAARRVVLEATGKDSRGNGTASARVAATLAPAGAGGAGNGEGESTAVGVVTDLTITGRPAQLGRGLIAEVGGKMLDAFADCLATELAGPAATGAAPSASSASSASASSASSASSRSSAPSAPSAASAAPSTSVGLSPEPEPSHDGSFPRATPAADGAAAPAASPAAPRPVGSADEIDLLNLAGPSVLKRLAPVFAGVLALLLILRWLRRRG
jgi:carbon monoxide dehydrogenase subunit G